MRGNGDEPFEMSSLRLLHHALAHGDQESWSGFQQCMEEAVLTWLHEHPSREAACRELCEKDVVAQTFERFQQGACQAHVTFETQAAMLLYLRASLQVVILERLRTLSRPKGVKRHVPGPAGEPRIVDQLDSKELWELLQTLLPVARERRLAYLLYHCGLGPQEIVQCCSQEWSDVQEIYRLRRSIVERFLHQTSPLGIDLFPLE